MHVDQFDFDLPEERIALRPVTPRDSARLLQVSGGGHVSDHNVRDLLNILGPGDLLVVNDTKVIPAALTAVRPAREHGGGGDVKIDINLLEPDQDGVWQAFARPAKRLRVGDIVHISEAFSAEILEKSSGGQIRLRFDQAGQTLAKAIAECGEPPLPPYIARKRGIDDSDIDDYQTVYAREGASVAAPTAGLHFTHNLIDALKDKGVKFAAVNLTVGAGTFLPVSADNTDEHTMHSEKFVITSENADTINDVKSGAGRVIAVGTTALRALESAAESGQVRSADASTDIFIRPGYKFQVVDGLMTNFHLPKSTLFMLVSALSGLETMQRAYAHAIAQRYRFYSYGDASLLWAKT